MLLSKDSWVCDWDCGSVWIGAEGEQQRLASQAGAEKPRGHRVQPEGARASRGGRRACSSPRLVLIASPSSRQASWCLRQSFSCRIFPSWDQTSQDGWDRNRPRSRQACTDGHGLGVCFRTSCPHSPSGPHACARSVSSLGDTRVLQGPSQTRSTNTPEMAHEVSRSWHLINAPWPFHAQICFMWDMWVTFEHTPPNLCHRAQTPKSIGSSSGRGDSYLRRRDGSLPPTPWTSPGTSWSSYSCPLSGRESEEEREGRKKIRKDLNAQPCSHSLQFSAKFFLRWTCFLVHPKGNQSWIFIGRTDAKAETPILWPPDVKSWLIGKDPVAGKDWRKAGGEGDDGGWDDWMASPTQQTWVWVSSGSWWWTGRPGVLQSVGSQRVWHNRVTGLNCFWSSLSPRRKMRVAVPAFQRLP